MSTAARWWLLALVALAAAAGLPPAAFAAAPGYVGTAQCATCHAKEHAAWRGSQHDRAMEEANGSTVLGNFADATFARGGTTTRFFRRDGRYFVNTDGPDGKPADFEVKYTFGVHPLQQYLIALPGGRLQAFGIAWDTRPKAAGGQRWFHLYPERKLKAGDPLHWTGIDQNWNYQCADCHSTNVRKNYDEATGSYRTTWSEIDVGCEACHGPGERHVAWARATGDARRADATRGLVVAFDERRGATWAIDAASGNATRSAPRSSSREIDTCARCHARRGQVGDTWHPGTPLGDTYRVATLEPGLYYADGQMRDEVYNHGSFLQSRMHASGVTCADCHEPHSQKLRVPGNGVCGQCHAPAKFDGPGHHHHAPGTAGAACASCHMPTTTYMVVDPRHDHSMRIPRPDRTLALGVPNACGNCHAKRGARWAADAVARWYPQRKPGFQRFAEALAAGDQGAPGARAALAGLSADSAAPSIARASALARLARYHDPSALAAIDKALADGDAQVRLAAALALRDADPARRAQRLPKLLADPIRTVRIEAARGLAGIRPAQLTEGDRALLAKARDEFLDALRFNADRPESHAELGSYLAASGEDAPAVAAFRRALALDATYAPAAVNLADLHRARGREDDAEAVLRAAIRADPAAAGPHHALGLSLARRKRMPEALAALGEAVRLAPDDARYGYVYGVALHDAGRRPAALKALETTRRRQPYDRAVLFALATYEREAGNTARAAQHAKLLTELEPDDANLRRFAQTLEAAAVAQGKAR